MHWTTIARKTCLLVGLLAAGCASDVGDVSSTSEALSRGKSDVYDCFQDEPDNSICVGNGITFSTADLHLERCDVTRTGTVCSANPAESPNMPVEFWGSPTEQAYMSCDTGFHLVCLDFGGFVMCNCLPAPPSGGDGGGDDGSVIWEVVE